MKLIIIPLLFLGLLGCFTNHRALGSQTYSHDLVLSKKTELRNGMRKQEVLDIIGHPYSISDNRWIYINTEQTSVAFIAEGGNYGGVASQISGTILVVVFSRGVVGRIE